jgi:hypothetical protein
MQLFNNNYFYVCISELQEKDVQEDVRWELTLITLPFQDVQVQQYLHRKIYWIHGNIV